MCKYVSDGLITHKMSELHNNEPAAVPPDETRSTLRIFTWNINGIRSLDDFQERLQKTEADIICVQETKVLVFIA